jgi:hypothetical protein
MMWQQLQPVVKIATNELNSLFEAVHPMACLRAASRPANASIEVVIRLAAVGFSGFCPSARSIYAW